MSVETAPSVHLADYKPPAYWVDETRLTFRLSPTATRVSSRIKFRPNDSSQGPFRLDGENLKLISASINGNPVSPALDDTGLTCEVPSEPFVWECEVEIAPEENTRLEGLYMSNGMYCTQCEAEGFRRITFYPDRPDVMAPFWVRIESDLPVLLSNGNPVAQEAGWSEWHDPWPKPAYLFALVAGALVPLSDQFKTMSGRDVALNIYVRPGLDEDKRDWAMDSLKRSMKWDEDTYGREYDLDVFNIVAVHDFNMGAMENKGLNIFNSALVLASPETATDHSFELIEAVIAHEYFHNWTGNRITCRDWFQLSLKEGLTVFRDQQFTSDMRSPAVKRIADVAMLRARQFREDGGPLAHPVRPASYVEINNFYTTTVYEKGAEVIGMLKRLVGDDAYRQALDLYFERHDGEAATIEDWLSVFEETTGRDLSQFKLWYSQAGTPRVAVEESYSDGTLTLTFEQSIPPTPGQKNKAPMVIPIAVGLLGSNGDEVRDTVVLELTEARQSFQFDGLSSKPVASILREFSAPVIIERKAPVAEREFLLAHDTDPFNRWDAGRDLVKAALIALIEEEQAPSRGLLDALTAMTLDQDLDPAFKALALGLPSEDDLAKSLSEAGSVPDPMAIWAARETFTQLLAERLGADLPTLMARCEIDEPYRPDARQSGLRAFGLMALSLQSRLDGGRTAERAFEAATNFTNQFGALKILLRSQPETTASERFYTQWREEPLVIDGWFAAQVAASHPDKTVDLVQDLAGHADFNWRNPNRFRALFRNFGSHVSGFHRADGAGYDLLADWLIRLDPVNPQIAARMCASFETWRQYDAGRQAKMRDAMLRISRSESLSRDSEEMLGRILGA